MATVKLSDVQKIYPNHVQAVYDFNLEIKDKEFVVLVGPSGCGKSTTLRMIAGLEDISDGELFIDGKLMNFVDPKDRNVAMVFQSYALYPHMTVYDNIAFSLEIRKSDHPVLAPDPRRDEIEKEITARRKEFFSLIRKAGRNNKNREKYEAEAMKIKEDLDRLFKELHEHEAPSKGLCPYLMKRSLKAAKKAEKDAKALKRKIASGEQEVAKRDEAVAALEKDGADEKKLKSARDKANMDHHILNSLKIELASKTKEAEDERKKAAYYKENETELVKSRKMTKNEVFEEVLHAAEILDLYPYLYRKPAALSGGQRQRVALGRAIVRRPKVFLMDEPLSNLDAKLRTQTRTEIAHIHKAVGATTVYVTHDQVEALTLADRIVIMKDGHIQQVATPKEAYERPANMFVAGFIGSPGMNFLKGTYEKGSIRVQNGDKEIAIDVSPLKKKALDAYEGKEIVIGVRPEYMHLLSEYKDDDPIAKVRLAYSDTELVGHEIIVYFRIGDSRLAAKISSKASLEEGKEYDFAIELQRARFFDPETTLAIV